MSCVADGVFTKAALNRFCCYINSIVCVESTDMVYAIEKHFAAVVYTIQFSVHTVCVGTIKVGIITCSISRWSILTIFCMEKQSYCRTYLNNYDNCMQMCQF